MANIDIPQLQARYQQIMAQFHAGQIAWEQALGLIAQLRAQDDRGVWWSVQPQTGQLMYYNGQQWLPGRPPPVGSMQARHLEAGQAPPAHVSAGQMPHGRMPSGPTPGVSRATLPPGAPGAGSGLVQSWVRFAATPLLALLPGAFCGGTWFLYTAVGIFKNEGIFGIDWLTPAILVGLPPLLWVLSRPLDKLLLPLQPLRRAIPMPMRLGGALALPVVLSCCLTTISDSGYTALHLASFVSILTSYMLFRSPEVRA